MSLNIKQNHKLYYIRISLLVAYLKIFANKEGETNLIFIIDIINGEAGDSHFLEYLQ